MKVKKLKAEEYISIFEKTLIVPEYGQSNLVPFKVNEMQRELLEQMDSRNIILKARKEGFTTIILAIAIVNCYQFENYHAVFLADSDDNTVGIFEKGRDMVETCKHNLGAVADKRQIKFGNGSWIKIATAGKKRPFQGADVHFLHFSEIGSYEHPGVYASAIEAAPSNALVFLESTANGRNLFYTLWNKALTGYHKKEFAYKPFFFGWNRHPKNTYTVPENMVLTEEENGLIEEYKLSLEQIAWRRWKPTAMPDPDMFPQEHPIYPDEAFLSSGRPVFSANVLGKMRGTAKDYRLGDIDLNRKGELHFYDNKFGNWQIFVMPEKTKNYVIGADISEGKGEKGDYSVASIWDAQTGEQVAEFRSKNTDPDIFAMELKKGGVYYNTALIAPERNAAGFSVISDLWNDYNYPRIYQEVKENDKFISETKENLGFRTNRKTRQQIIDLTKRAIRLGTIKINSLTCIEESLAFEYDNQGRAEHPQGKHDDTVFAMMIALYVMDKLPEIRDSVFQDSGTNYYKLIGKRPPSETQKNFGKGGY